MRATSRLTFWTSSSDSCCSSSALIVRPARSAAWPPCAAAQGFGACLVGVEDHRLSTNPRCHFSSSRIQVRRICADISGSLLDLFAQVLGQHFGRLGDNRRQLRALSACASIFCCRASRSASLDSICCSTLEPPAAMPGCAGSPLSGAAGSAAARLLCRVAPARSSQQHRSHEAQ